MDRGFWPISLIRGLFRRKPGRERSQEFPRLYDRRLERRRVLDAGPFGAATDSFDDATLANDGQGDHFEVGLRLQEETGEIAASVDGQTVQVGTEPIRIEGSTDHDTVSISSEGFDPETTEIEYTWLDDSSLQITVDRTDTPETDITLIVSGVEQIDDQVGAAKRVFDVGGVDANVQLADNAAVDDGQSLLQTSLGTRIGFGNPTRQLVLDSSDNGASLTQWNISGVDGQFAANLSVAGDMTDSVSLRESLDIGGGSLSALAGSIDVTATISVGGGDVELRADELSFTGELTAGADSLIRFDAGETGNVTVAGRIEALGVEEGSTGGFVAISGAEVELLGEASIDVSGHSGGGGILIGGGLRGTSDLIRTAAHTTVGENVQLIANAFEAGNGGLVVVWAEGTTRFQGSIEARGGQTSGDGGLAEVSGRDSLLYLGQVSLAAPAGEHGALIIDPATITVTQTHPPGTDEVSTTQIEAAAMDFTILADVDVIFNDLSDLGGGEDVVTLMSNVDLIVSTTNTSGNTGGITFNNPSNDLDSIVASGDGNLSFEAGTDGGEEADIANVGNLTTATGNIELTASGDIGVLGDIATTSGNVTITADSNDSGAGAVTTASSITTTSGDITISGEVLNLDNLNVAGGTGTVTLVSDSIDISANATSIAGTGTLVIRAESAATEVGIGTATGTLNIEDGEIDEIADGFDLIVFGDASSSTGTVEIDTATFLDDLEVHGGSILVEELDAGSNDVTLNARTGNLVARDSVSTVDVTGGAIVLNAAGTIGESGGNGSLQISGSTLTTDTSGSNGDQFLDQSGSITVAGLDAGTGDIQLETGTYVVGSAATIDATALAIQSGADLAGDGTVNANVTVSDSNSTLTPGNSSTAQLTINGSLDLQSSTTYDVAINGTTAGTDYDQVQVSGDVTLAGSLSVTKGFTASIGDSFTILNVTGGSSTVTGTFSGLSEGAVFASGSQFMQITYQGGTGNDVALTVVGSVFSIAADNASVNEGNSGTTDFTFTVTRAGETSGAATLNYTVTGSGSNVAEAADFNGGSFPSGMVMFADGESMATITIEVVGDQIVEGDEEFAVTISDPPTDGSISTASAVSTITNDDSATVTLSGQTVNEGTLSPHFTVTLSQEVDVDVTVELDTLGTGSATAVDDYTAITDQVVTITAGSLSQTVSVTVVDDNVVEADETINGQIDTLSAGGRSVSIAGSTASATIANVDAAIVTLSGGMADENSGPLQFTVTLDNPVDQNVSVRFDTLGTGTATSGNDFTAINNQLVTISAGDTSATVDVTLSGDTVVELDESVDGSIDMLNNGGRSVTLSGGGSSTTGSGTITNDDSAVITVSGGMADENSGPLEFTVTLSNEVDADVTVDFDTLLSGTATSGTDFTAISNQTVTISAGDTSTTVDVTLSGDTVVELDETVDAQVDSLGSAGRDVTLSGGGASTAGSGTIVNDDSATITFTGESESEESGNPLFTVTLSNEVDADVTVQFDTLLTGTATVVDDFTAIANQVVTISAGSLSQTVTVTVIDDNLVEADETIGGQIDTLNASGRDVILTGMASSLSDLGTITNTDAAVITLNGGMVAENSGPLQFTVMLDNPVDVDVSVEFDSLLTGTATSGTDFTAITDQVVTISAGDTSATVDVSLIGDSIVELDETINARIDSLIDGGRSVTLSGGASTTGSGTITNDDSAVVNFSGGTTAENAGPLQFTATLTNQVDTAVTVDFSTLLSGTAGAGDFSAVAGQTITFAAGDVSETIDVTLTNETIVELDETLDAQLGTLDASGRAVTLSGGGATLDASGTITNDDSATIELLDVTANESTGQLVFTVQLSNQVDADISVTFETVAGGTATATTDYTTVAGSPLTVNALDTTATFTVSVVNDLIVENDETVNTRIHTLVDMGRNVMFAGGGTDSTAVGTIEDNDVQTVMISDPTASEGAGVIAFEITLGSVAADSTDVTFDTLLTGTATSGSDFTALNSHVVTFLPGETSQIVEVTIADDLIVELDETIDARARATVFMVDLEDIGTGTIQNNDQATVSIADVTVTEGNTGTVSADFAVTLSHEVDAAVTFNSATMDVTATSGSGDYSAQGSTAQSFTANSAAGSMQTISVAVSGDNLVELTESFLLQLSSLGASGRDVIFDGAGATLSGTGTITNDDAATLSIAGVTAAENTGQLQYQLTLSNPVDTDVTVEFDTFLGGTAIAGTDYTVVTDQTITISANSTSTTANVTVNDENLVEADETVFARIDTLVNAGRNVTLGTTAAAGTIQNDDTAVIALSANTVNESTGAVTFTATLSNPVDTAVAIEFSTLATGTATVGDDFTPISNLSITFLANDQSETVFVAVTDDSVVEDNETLLGQVNNLTPVARNVTFSGGTSANATGTINNDDSASLTVGGLSILEGSSGTTNFNFVVTLTGEVQGGFDAPFTITDGTGTDADDFDVVTLSPLTFAGTNLESHSIVVQVDSDNKVELDEQFTVALNALQSIDAISAAAVTLSGPVTGEILNDDSTTISVEAIAGSTVAEGDTGTTDVTFEVRLSNPTDLAVTANVATVDGSVPGSQALAGDDYTALNQTITFNAGASDADLIQVVTVTASTDSRFELDENFSLVLINPLIDGGIDATRLTTGNASVAGTILNDDTDIIESGGGNDDTLTITSTGADSGSFVLTIDGVAGPVIPFSGITSVTFDGLAGDDQLSIIQNSGSAFQPAGGIVFNGGTQGANGDLLEITGGTIDSATATVTSQSDIGLVYGTATATGNGVEQLKFTPTSLDEFTVAFASVTNDNIQITDDGITGNDISRLTTLGGSSPTIDFSTPDDMFTVDAGQGDDVIELASGFDSSGASGTFDGGLTINGNTGTDVVTFNGGVSLDGDDLIVTGEVITVNEKLATDGGSIAFTSAGAGSQIAIDDGGTLNSGSGTINLLSEGDVTLGSVVSQASGTAISIESQSGGIVDGGDSATDLVALTGIVQLTAFTGIGSGNALETNVGGLSVTTQNGSIEISELGSLTLHGAHRTNSAGTGDILIQAADSIHVAASGTGVSVANNGDITLDAGDDLTIDDTTMVDDILVGGSGTFIGRAGSDVSIAADAVIRTSTGHIVGLPGTTSSPSIAPQDLGGPGINVDGDNRGTLDITTPEGSGFEIIVDWMDFPAVASLATLAPVNGLTPVVVSHQYILGNPSGDATSPIPYLVTIEFGHNGSNANTIQLFSEGNPLVFEFSGELTVPSTGLQLVAAVAVPEIEETVAEVVAPAEVVTQVIANTETSSNSFDFGTISADFAAADVERVELRIVTPTGDEITVYQWDRSNIDILKNLAELFGDLPDDRYRIYLVRVDGTETEVVDVILINHKPFDPADDAEADRIRPPQDDQKIENLKIDADKITPPDETTDANSSRGEIGPSDIDNARESDLNVAQSSAGAGLLLAASRMKRQDASDSSRSSPSFLKAARLARRVGRALRR